MRASAARLLLLGTLLPLAAGLPLPPFAGQAAAAEGPNGFSLENAAVPRDSILAGGPPRDGIRSVDAPEFAPAPAARWIAGDDPLVGVALGEDARGYPIHLLEYHQIVNDVVNEVPVAVTYDPLTDVSRVFRRRVGDRTLTFGVSGLVHNSSFLLYDRETESLWLQFTGECIAGELAGRELARVPSRQEIRDAWLARHPETKILKRPEPKRIDYRYSPFTTYWVRDEVPFPVRAEDSTYHAKEVVIGVEAGDVERAYLGSQVTAAGGRVSDRVDGHEIEVHYDTHTASFLWTVPEGVEVTRAYWFAWKAFHPDTEVWRPEGGEGGGDGSGPS